MRAAETLGAGGVEDAVGGDRLVTGRGRAVAGALGRQVDELERLRAQDDLQGAGRGSRAERGAVVARGAVGGERDAGAGARGDGERDGEEGGAEHSSLLRGGVGNDTGS